MSTKETRQLAFEQYTKKWGLDKYVFICNRYGLLAYERNNELAKLDYHIGKQLEIKAIKTLLERGNFSVSLWHGPFNRIVYANLKEFIATTLLEKLAGI